MYLSSTECISACIDDDDNDDDDGDDDDSENDNIGAYDCR